MSRLINNHLPLILACAMLSAWYFGGTPHVGLKLVALFTLLWMAPLIVIKAVREHPVSWDQFAVTALAGVALIWSFGLLA